MGSRGPINAYNMAMAQNLRYPFGDGYHPTIVFFEGFLGCSPGYRGFDPLPYNLKKDVLLTIPKGPNTSEGVDWGGFGGFSTPSQEVLGPLGYYE